MKLQTKDEFEITLEIEDDDFIAIIHESDENFSVSDRVRILTDPAGAAGARHLVLSCIILPCRPDQYF